MAARTWVLKGKQMKHEKHRSGTVCIEEVHKTYPEVNLKFTHLTTNPFMVYVRGR